MTNFITTSVHFSRIKLRTAQEVNKLKQIIATLFLTDFALKLYVRDRWDEVSIANAIKTGLKFIIQLGDALPDSLKEKTVDDFEDILKDQYDADHQEVIDLMLIAAQIYSTRSTKKHMSTWVRLTLRSQGKEHLTAEETSEKTKAGTQMKRVVKSCHENAISCIVEVSILLFVIPSFLHPLNCLPPTPPPPPPLPKKQSESERGDYLV